MLSRMLGRGLSAKRPRLPPSSKPPGFNMAAISPVAYHAGIWATVFLKTPGKLAPSLVLSTLLGSSNTFGKLMYVYPKMNSFVIVGLNTCVRLAVTESDLFFPRIGVGYGTW